MDDTVNVVQLVDELEGCAGLLRLARALEATQKLIHVSSWELATAGDSFVRQTDG